MKQMRRAVSLVLALMMLVSMFSINMIAANAEEAKPPLLGDVNSDGVVNIFDASAIQKSLAKKAGYINYKAIEDAGETDRIEFRIADVHKDGHITIFDASRYCFRYSI